MVTDYVSEISLLNASLEADDVEETVIALRELRSLLDRKKAVQLHSDKDCILHLPLGITRMDVPALYVDLGRSGVEILEFEFSDLAAVHRICEFSPEFLHIELRDSAADFLVRGKFYLDFPVLEFRVFHDVLHGVHYLGDTGLVIRTEKRRAVSRDDCLAFMGKQFREFGRLQRQSRHTFELYVPSVVILDDLRTDICPGSIRGGVHVGYETYHRHFPVNVGRDCPHYISIFV